MQSGNDFYTPREKVEELLEQTLANAEHKQGKSEDKRPVKKKKRIVQRVVYIALVIAMLAMLGKVWYQKINGENPSLFGYQIYVVETGSMVPTLPVGTNILVRILHDGDTLQAGDIITFTHHETAVTHRIVEVIAGDDGVTRYQTKGDNPENSPDPWLVERADIRGVVVWHFSLANLLGK